MKATALIFLLFFLGKGCSEENKNDIKTAVIEYTANTRGYYRKVIIQNQTVSVSKVRDSKANPTIAEKISESDMKELVKAFQEVNLDEIADLKSPTEKRFYDGAAMADVEITYKGKTYKSQTFDHGNPPVEIERLVDQVTSFIKSED